MRLTIPGEVVIICGGRTWGRVPDSCPLPQRPLAELKAAKQRELLVAKLLEIMARRGRFRLVRTGGGRGADWFADNWARLQDLVRETVLPNWDKFGKAAGPIRNNGMLLRDPRPNLVIAFPGDNGTADMVDKAFAAGIEVIQIDENGNESVLRSLLTA